MIFGPRQLQPALLRTAVAALSCTLCACPAPRAPRAPEIGAQTLALPSTPTGVAGSATHLFAASSAPNGATVVEARKRGSDATLWRIELPGFAGPLTIANDLVIAALGATGNTTFATLRGEPGSLLVALDASTGAIRWSRPVDASEWSLITSIATANTDLIIGGSFTGTLRIGARVVTSGGKSDGFVARLTATGDLVWLLRVGGPGSDAVQAVATSADRIAITGSFSLGADLLGEPLVSIDQRSPATDGFVAELDPTGTRRWSASFGGKYDETIAGVTIAGSRVAVATNVRDRVRLAGHDLAAQGPADGAIAWWTQTGEPAGARLIGGTDFDGLRAITSVDDRIVLAGFYAGTLSLGAQTLTADGGDDAFLAALDPSGAVITAWPIRGEGREEITALAAIPGGFLAGLSHSAAASIDGIDLPSPKAPSSSAALIIRPL